MALVNADAYGHLTPSTGTALTAGAVSTTAVGTIAPTTAAGNTPTVTAVNANDVAGNFVLNPVTGGGAQAAGAVVLVTFANPYAVAPKSILVTVCDQAGGSGSTPIAAAVPTITAGSFNINVGTALTTAHNYFVTYEVTP